MTNDRDQELERLEKELLADIPLEDDLLADLPIDLLDTTPTTWTEEALLTDEDLLLITSEDLEDYPPTELNIGEDMKQAVKKPAPKKKNTNTNTKKQEDRWLVWLMAVASFLCLGIIGVLIYWLEIFLK